MALDTDRLDVKDALGYSAKWGGGASLAAYLADVILPGPSIPVITTGAGVLTGRAVKKGKPLEIIIGFGVGAGKIGLDLITFPINPIGAISKAGVDGLTYVGTAFASYSISKED